ncbi:alternative oxidase-domain-containing protein [Radiomyces spectabilis]|uniref:alternative oxidase-domain-containing protein n=1 Tax=Radiomyces spectabilis TaxID=64574 RepID=UPI00221F3B33|nr:alternative oxidase-domain-containing protein [Radiomyces spectabilis]KAI8369602.1 alternative oxidase-domain-containing protein [Radiomyces spectabilis]
MREVQSTHPMPIRDEFLSVEKITSEQLEKLDIGQGSHRQPLTLSDTIAYRMVKMLRVLPDTYFGRDHYMRAVMLETIAAVPGMVGGMLRHMQSLRNMSEDKGWIIHLLHEAENERMHLMTWMKCLQPTLWNRLLVLGAQGVFFNAYFWLYVFSPKTAHRMCGYLEEEAVISYTHFLEDLDAGLISNGPAPPLAIEYYNLHPHATIRDVILAIRADEALHRDANHHFSDRIAAGREDLTADIRARLHQDEIAKTKHVSQLSH